MKRKTPSPFRGIVLVTTLMLLCFLVILATAMMVSTMRQQMISGRYYQKEQALLAAETGVNYAMMKLAENPYWEGTNDGSDYEEDFESGTVEVYGWKVSDKKGVVEGKLFHGGNYSTFEIYFVSPGSGVSKMRFFNSDSIPTKIALSLNNYGSTSVATSAYYSDGTAYRTVPGGYVLLACRGKCGEETRIVETCVMVSPAGDFDATVIGKGSLSFTLDGSGDMILESQNKAPKIRANGDITVNTFAENTNWLSVATGGEGKANGSINFTPEPDYNGSAFIGDAGEQSDYIPLLEWEDVVPDTGKVNFNSVSAGIYVITPPSGSASTPTITYYATDNPSDIEEGTVSGTTTNSLTSLLNNGITWKRTTRTLVISQSLEITPSGSSDTTGVNGFTILTDGEKSVSISLYDYDDGEKKFNDVYLYNSNENGFVYLDGELCGVGSVIAKGDIDLEPESQLTANTSSGLSLYSSGSINFHEISKIRANLDSSQVINLNTNYGKDTPVNDITNGNTPETGGDDTVYSDYANAKKGMISLYSYFNNLEEADSNTIKKQDLSGRSFISDLFDSTYTPSDTDIETLRSDLFDTWQLLDDMGYVWHHPSNSLLDELRITPTIVYETYNQLANNGWKLPKSQDESEEFEGKYKTHKDAQFSGLIYAGKDFTFDAGNNKFILNGILVARGSDDGTGNINVNAESVLLNYDSKYLSVFNSDSVSVSKLFWTTY